MPPALIEPTPRSPQTPAARSLGLVPVGGCAVVRQVRCPRPVARRLMEMGLLPGTPVQVTRVAPLGDPLVLSVRGSAISIRHAEALGVEVDDVRLAAS